MSESMNAIDVAYQTKIAIKNKSTEQLAAEANTFYHQAESLAGMSAAMLAEAGRRLIETKRRIPHGEFTDWCEKNLEFSYRKAARMMQLAEKMEDENSLFSKMPTLAPIGISRVWELLAAPEEVAAEVVETTDVESLTVRELKEEIARIKEEKEAAEHKAEMIDRNNDDIRKELASMQRKLSETVSETEFEEMQAAAQAQKEDLTKELTEAKAATADAQIKLDKAKEDLKRAKEKLKESEAAKDEEVQKRLAEAAAELEEKHADDIKKAKEEGAADAEASLGQMTDEIMRLEAQIEKLESEKAKLSNTSLMEFKVMVDQLQDIYFKINDMITEQNERDPELGLKMQNALKNLVERWIP